MQVLTERRELAYRLLPPLSDELLELRVPHDRNACEARERVDRVRRQATFLADRRLLELRDQGARRREARVPPQPPCEVSDRAEADGRVGRLVAKGHDLLDLRPVV